MNKRMISFILGTLLILEAVILLLPALVALIYAERAGWYYLFTALGAALAGLALRLISRPTRKTIYARDGLLCVALGWVVLSLAGALPFTLCGDIRRIWTPFLRWSPASPRPARASCRTWKC